MPWESTIKNVLWKITLQENGLQILKISQISTLLYVSINSDMSDMHHLSTSKCMFIELNFMALNTM